MATNRDLLKEAIADAKAVKETAIANAKAALEEAFTPYLKEKLSAKINEMEVDEEFELEENDLSEVEKEMKEMKKDEDMTEEVSLDELLAELEKEESMEESMDEDLYEAKDEEEMAIEDMSEDDLKSFIEDVIKDMVSAGELEAGHEGMENEEGAEMEMGDEDEMEADEEELDEEFDINELLAEIEESENVDEANFDVTNPQSAGASAAAGATVLAKKLDNLVDAIRKGLSGSSIEAIAKDIKDGLANIGKAAGGATRMEEETSELEEQLAELKSELNEVNLLNAKLLYTNKIFRNKSLTESQKVKVLTSFDKATSKKEVELVYETLIESLKVSTTKAPIKESLGSASKALGGATSKPIIENDAFARMRELAFGRNK